MPSGPPTAPEVEIMTQWDPVLSHVHSYGQALASCCIACQTSRNLLPLAPLHPWSFPNSPWSRFHMDYADPVDKHILLVVVEMDKGASCKICIISDY